MSSQLKFRITLWDRTGTGGWRGAVKAVVFDAKAIGSEEQANDVGSAFWTLPNDHQQITQFVPLERHYEIDRWSTSRSRWEFIAAGILNDYTVTDYETTFSGLDYKAVLEQDFTAFPGMTIGDSASLNPNLSASEFYGSIYGVTGVTTNATTTISVSGVTVSPLVIDSVTNTTSSGSETLTGPSIELKFDLNWAGSSTGFDAGTQTWSAWVIASPSGPPDDGQPPLGTNGVIAYVQSISSDATTGVNRFKATGVTLKLFGYETGKQTNQLTRPVAMYPSILYSSTYNRTIFPLRNGVTYKFQIYASIYQSSTATYHLAKVGKISDSVTLGQGTNETANTIISRLFADATSTKSRLDYSTLTTISSATATHTTYLYGKNVLTAIADVCDLQMGADTSKVVTFGIDRPSGTSDYNGKFKLNLDVTSSTSLALMYPYTLKSFSYTPGYASVRNEITVIPSGQYLSGSSAQNYGINTIGATSSDTASIGTIGRIPLIVTKTGFINEEAATKEAARLKSIYSSANTRRIGFSVVVDGVEMWNGWDLGSTVNVTIKTNTLVSVGMASGLQNNVSNLVALDNTPFIISGVRWFGETEGHERIEMDLVLASAFRAGRAS